MSCGSPEEGESQLVVFTGVNFEKEYTPGKFGCTTRAYLHFLWMWKYHAATRRRIPTAMDPPWAVAVSSCCTTLTSCSCVTVCFPKQKQVLSTDNSPSSFEDGLFICGETSCVHSGSVSYLHSNCRHRKGVRAGVRDRVHSMVLPSAEAVFSCGRDPSASSLMRVRIHRALFSNSALIPPS